MVRLGCASSRVKPKETGEESENVGRLPREEGGTAERFIFAHGKAEGADKNEKRKRKKLMKGEECEIFQHKKANTSNLRMIQIEQ
jgi:hypothetical protein